MKKSRFSRQIVTTIISRGVQLGIGFLTGIVVARYLGAHGRGYLALLLAVRVPAAEMLHRAGFDPVALPDGSFAVSADKAHGVALVFG